MLLKTIHMSLAFLSGAGFIVRSVFRLYTNQKLTQKWLRVVPHIIDTFLLISAVMLAMQTTQYPFVEHWLTVKLMALFGYIGFGIAVMRVNTTRITRSLLFIAAFACYVYILSVAITRNPLPFY